MVKITFKYEDGSSKEVEAQVGENLLDVARDFDIDIEGACGGVCACATCHVWVADPWLNKLPEITDQENDMLDQASQIEASSRLCCRLTVDESMDGMEITVPNSSKNISGHHH